MPRKTARRPVAVSNTDLRTRLAQMTTGFSALIAPNQLFETKYAPARTASTLTAPLQQGLAAFAELDARLRAVAAQRQVIDAAVKPLMVQLEELGMLLRTYFGVSNPVLASFGLKPVQPRRRLTSIESAQKAVKLRETRKLRKTMGKRQRKALRAP